MGSPTIQESRTVHTIRHWPATGTGFGVCDCGATIRVENGTPTGTWHACRLCVHPWFHDEVTRG